MAATEQSLLPVLDLFLFLLTIAIPSSSFIKEKRAAGTGLPVKSDKPTGRQLFEADTSMASSDSKFTTDGKCLMHAIERTLGCGCRGSGCPDGFCPWRPSAV